MCWLLNKGHDKLLEMRWQEWLTKLWFKRPPPKPSYLHYWSTFASDYEAALSEGVATFPLQTTTVIPGNSDSYFLPAPAPPWLEYNGPKYEAAKEKNYCVLSESEDCSKVSSWLELLSHWLAGTALFIILFVATALTEINRSGDNNILANSSIWRSPAGYRSLRTTETL